MVTQYTKQGKMVHIDSNCRVMNPSKDPSEPDAEPVETVNSIEGLTPCLCLGENASSEEQNTEQVKDDFFNELKNKTIDNLKAVDVLRGYAFKKQGWLSIEHYNILQNAHSVYKQNDNFKKLKRETVTEALIRKPSYDHRELMVLGEFLRKQVPVSDPLMLAWWNTWAKTGNLEEAKTRYLQSGGNWSSSKGEVIENQTQAYRHIETYEKALAAALTIIENKKPVAIALNRWEWYLGEINNETINELLATSDIKIFDKMAVVKLEYWAAKLLEVHLTEAWRRFPGETNYHKAIELGRAPHNWEDLADIAVTLWKDAKGTFRFEQDMYGLEKPIEGNANIKICWETAVAL